MLWLSFKFFMKPTINIVSIFLIFLLFSCSVDIGRFSDDKKLAKLSFFNSSNKKTFSFVISGKFFKKHRNKRPSDLYHKMNVDELGLLKSFLRDGNHCFNRDGNLSFKINSKQEKIYDVTFSNLIEKSYNAKPISPTTYFGECLQ